MNSTSLTENPEVFEHFTQFLSHNTTDHWSVSVHPSVCHIRLLYPNS